MGNIINSYANVAVTATGDTAGGLVGYNYQLGTILNSYAFNTSATVPLVSGGTHSSIGGLVGISNGMINNSWANGLITDASGQYIGGLAGSSGITGSIINGSYSKGTIQATDASYVGGLVGDNNGTIVGTVDGTFGSAVKTVYSTDAVNIVSDTSSGVNSIGGLAGGNESTGTIAHANASGNVTVTFNGTPSQQDKYIGGLVGNNPGIISYANAFGNVSATNGADVGGLVGWNTNGSTFGISYTTASGNVTGLTYVGGLVGFNGTNGLSYAVITNSSTSGGQLPRPELRRRDSGIQSGQYQHGQHQRNRERHQLCRRRGRRQYQHQRRPYLLWRRHLRRSPAAR